MEVRLKKRRQEVVDFSPFDELGISALGAFNRSFCVDLGCGGLKRLRRVILQPKTLLVVFCVSTLPRDCLSRPPSTTPGSDHRRTVSLLRSTRPSPSCRVQTASRRRSARSRPGTSRVTRRAWRTSTLSPSPSCSSRCPTVKAEIRRSNHSLKTPTVRMPRCLNLSPLTPPRPFPPLRAYLLNRRSCKTTPQTLLRPTLCWPHRLDPLRRPREMLSLSRGRPTQQHRPCGARRAARPSARSELISWRTRTPMNTSPVQPSDSGLDKSNSSPGRLPDVPFLRSKDSRLCCSRLYHHPHAFSSPRTHM